RHSFVADFYVYDLKTKSLVKVSDKKIQEPLFSPDGQKVAYVYQNNIYVFDLNAKTHTQVTTDGVTNQIINGVADWVYEEEFDFVRAFEWNKSGDKIAFLRFDETQVPEFSMDMYNQGLYPAQYVFKYPKAGENNSEVSLHIYDVNSRSTVHLAFVGDAEDYYIPRIKWTNDANKLSVQTLNRHQNELKLYAVDAKTANYTIVLKEQDKAYVDIHDNLTFLDDNSFIWTSEKDGFNHIYHYDKNGK